MSSIEDRLRAAMRAAGGTVTPGSAPPLRLPEDGGGASQGPIGASQGPNGASRSPNGSRGHDGGWPTGLSQARVWRRRTMPAWVAPLAAAAAVAAILWGLSIGVHQQPLIARPASSQPPDLKYPTTVYGLPSFYLSGVGTAIVSTASGRVIAVPRLPGVPGEIAAGSDGRTFYEALIPRLCAPGAQPWRTPASPAPGRPIRCSWNYREDLAWFYRITLTTTGPDVSQLPIPPVRHANLTTISPSPDGSRLAIATWSQAGGGGYVRTLAVASTATGRQLRTWTTTAAGSLEHIAWLADGRTVALDWQAFRGPGPASGLWLLDTMAPGRNLLLGKAVVAHRNPAGSFRSLAISPDGSTVIGVEQGSGLVNGRRVPDGSAVAFSARTGQATGVLFTAGPRRGGTWSSFNTLWVGHAGRPALLSCDFQRHNRSGRPQPGSMLVVLAASGHAPRPLPWLFRTWRVLFELGDMAER